MRQRSVTAAPSLIEPLRVLIAEYTALTRDLDWNPTVEGPRAAPAEGLPVVRGVSHHRAHRRRRHGRSVQAPRPAPRPHRRRQGPSPGRRAAGRRRRIPRRSALPRALLRSPHRAAARVPAGRESSRADHGARRRVRAGPHRAVARVPPARPRAARGVSGDRPRARAGHPAPRPQAVEHHGRRAAGPAHPRLRLERRRSEGGPSQGHAAIRRARTARAVAADRRADGRLRPRRDSLRAVVRPPAVHRQQRRHPRRHPARPAAPADRALAGCSGRPAGDRAQGDGARSGAPLSIGAGNGRRSRTVPRRASGARAAVGLHDDPRRPRGSAPRPHRRVAAPAADPSARSRRPPRGLSGARRARRRLDRREPRADLPADRSVSRRFPAGGRQSLLLRRRAMVRRRQRSRPAAAGARLPLRRPEPRGAAGCTAAITRPWPWRSTSPRSRCCRCC